MSDNPKPLTPAESARCFYLWDRIIGERCDIPASKEAVDRAVAAYEQALAAKREAEGPAREIADQLAYATGEAEFDLEERFVTESNRTFLVDGDQRVQMTADKKAKWIAEQVKRNPTVAELLRLQRKVDDEIAAARDAVTVAEKRISATTHILDTNTQMLATLTACLDTRGNR